MSCFLIKSDTEVIGHLYEEYGDDFVSYLNRQFAISVKLTLKSISVKWGTPH